MKKRSAALLFKTVRNLELPLKSHIYAVEQTVSSKVVVIHFNASLGALRVNVGLTEGLFGAPQMTVGAEVNCYCVNTQR